MGGGQSCHWPMSIFGLPSAFSTINAYLDHVTMTYIERVRAQTHAHVSINGGRGWRTGRRLNRDNPMTHHFTHHYDSSL